MVGPCDNCGGSGFDPTDGETTIVDGKTYGVAPCPACKDMPWLDWREFGTWVWNKFVPLDGPEWYSNHESRKPDRSTVMRWCDVHKAVGTGEICQAWDLVSMRIGRNPFNRPTCRIVWIKKPKIGRASCRERV